MISSLNLQPSRPSINRPHYRAQPEQYPRAPQYSRPGLSASSLSESNPLHHQQQRRPLTLPQDLSTSSPGSFYSAGIFQGRKPSLQQKPTSQVDAMPPHLAPPAPSAPPAMQQRQPPQLVPPPPPLLPPYNAATCHPVFFSGRWHRPPQFHGSDATAGAVDVCREPSMSPVAEGYVWARERSNSAIGGEGPKL